MIRKNYKVHNRGANFQSEETDYLESDTKTPRFGKLFLGLPQC